MKRKFVKVTAACVGGAIVLGNAASVSATTLETDTAAAGISVALNNYYATSLSPEADILAFLKPTVSSPYQAVKEQKTSVSQRTATGESKEIESTTVSANDTESKVGVIKVVGSLNIRKEPTTESEIVGRAYNDSVVTIKEEVEGEGGTWYHVVSGSVDGYVKAEYVTTGEEAEKEVENLGQTIAVVTTESLNVRASADEESEIVCKVYLNEECIVIEKDGEFLKVQTPDGTVGYVHQDYVSIGKTFDGAVSVDIEEQLAIIESYQKDIEYCFNTEYPNSMNEGMYYAAERVLEYVVELSDEIVKTAQPYGLDEVISKAGESKAEAMDKLAEVRALIEEYEAGLSDTEAPTTAAPETEAPTTTVPETQPTTTVPETEAPTTTVPETQPTTTVPETEAPTTTVPETQPTTTVPETQPTTTVPETQPTTTAPETQPTTTAPETEPPTEPSAPVSDVRTQLANEALYWVGKCNYVYGGNDLSIGGSIDCSGFTQTLYSRVAGISIPRTSYTQVYAGKQISYEQLQPGDLIFYTANGGPGAINHVAIYVGGGMMVHAASPELGIITSPVLYKQPAAYVSILG